MKKINKLSVVRFITLTIFLIIVTFFSFQHQILGGGSKGAPSTDALCPFGGLETIYKFLATKEFINRTNVSNFILLGGTIIITLFFSRLFCGFLCAVGWMQEIFAKIGQAIFKKRFVIPKVVDKYFRFLKYVILIIVLFFTWKIGELIIFPFFTCYNRYFNLCWNNNNNKHYRYMEG